MTGWENPPPPNRPGFARENLWRWEASPGLSSRFLLFFILPWAASFSSWVPAQAPYGSSLPVYASPTMGLVLALWLITRARFWSEVLIPATGMVTFGLSGLTAFILARSEFAPPTLLGYFTASTPVLLFLIGLFLLSRGRRSQNAATG